MKCASNTNKRETLSYHFDLPDPFVLKVIVVLLASTLCFLAATSLTLFLEIILQV